MPKQGAKDMTVKRMDNVLIVVDDLEAVQDGDWMRITGVRRA